MKLLIHPPVDDARLAKILEAAGSMEVVNATSDGQALGHIPDSDAFFGKMTPELLQVAGQLRWVQSPTASLEHYLFPELIEHQCMLSNMRGLFSDVIADHVMGFILCFARNFHQYIRNQQQGQWAPVGNEQMEEQPFLMGPCEVTPIDSSHIHLSDATIGVVGAGFIGQEVCRRAAAFGMRVIAVDPKYDEIPGIVEEVWNPDRLPDLLAESDFVVIAAPHTPATFKLFSREKFEQMKSTAYVINIGRGVIIDLEDLTQALQENQIAGAGLDVSEIEPLPQDHPLWSMPNVIITPHVAAASPRVSERHLATLLENIRQFAEGEPVTTLVDKQQWF